MLDVFDVFEVLVEAKLLLDLKFLEIMLGWI